MNDLSAPIAGKIGKLIRLLSSTKDGEVVAAAHALMRTLEANKLELLVMASRRECAQRLLTAHRVARAGRRVKQARWLRGIFNKLGGGQR